MGPESHDDSAALQLVSRISGASTPQPGGGKRFFMPVRKSWRRSEQMTDKTIELDQHRGMQAQKATEIRRLLAEVEADQLALRVRQEELETHLVATPASNWHDAAEKARYLLTLFARSSEAQDPRRQKLIKDLLDDFTRLSRETLESHPRQD
jgi:hypothetical protein